MHDIKVAYHDKALYYYDQIVNSASITRRYTIETLRQRMLFINELRQVIGECNCVGIADAVTSVAIECYKRRVLSARQFAEIFAPYKEEFMRSNYKYKYKMVLRMAASGYQTLARMIS